MSPTPIYHVKGKSTDSKWLNHNDIKNSDKSSIILP